MVVCTVRLCWLQCFDVNLEHLSHFSWVLDLSSCHWAQDLAVFHIVSASQKQHFPKLSVSYWYLGVVWVTELHRQRESIFFSSQIDWLCKSSFRQNNLHGIHQHTNYFLHGATARIYRLQSTGNDMIAETWQPNHANTHRMLPL